MTAAVPNHAEWTALAQELRGRLSLPGMAEYEARRRVWNGAIDRHPLAIAHCADADDVARVTRFAAHHALPMSVRGGGHNVAGSAVRDGALMLDLGGLNAVEVSADRSRVRVGGGALWREVDAATKEHACATTGGMISSTGVGGYTQGGGVGWLMRRCGLAIDNLISADVVLADGSRVHASAESEPDLFWALRGGGGGFGVVTSFVFRLHALAEVYAGALFHPIDAAHELLRRFRDQVADAPDELTAMVVFCSAPPAPFLPASVHGQRVGVLAWCWSGDPEQGRARLAALLDPGRALGQVGGVMPYPQWQCALDTHAPAGDQYYWTTAHVDALDDALIETLVRHGSEAADPASELHVHHLGGALARVPLEGSAFVHRGAPFFVNAIGRTPQAQSFAAVRDWARGLRSAVAPWARVGVNANFTSEEGDLRERTHDAATLTRLAELRRRYDPRGLFALAS